MSLSGLGDYTYTFDDSVIDETVTTASLSIDTSLMSLVGVDTLSAPARTVVGAAGTVEISIVVDNSKKGQNHQGDYTKGTETMLQILRATAGDDRVYVNVVPYTTAVALPQAMWDEYNVTEFHNHSRCVYFDDLDYDDVMIYPTGALDQFPHFEVSDNNGWESIEHPECRTEATSEISPFMDDPLDVYNALDTLVKGEFQHVAAQDGMKWGMALLDPVTRPVVTSLVSQGVVDPALAGLPRDYGTQDNYKALILLFGHQGNTERKILKPEYRTALSPFWWDEAAEEQAIYFKDPNGTEPSLWKGDELYCKKLETRSGNFAGLSQGEIETYYALKLAGLDWLANWTIRNGTARPMTWAEVIEMMPLEQYGDCIFYKIGKELDLDPALKEYWNTALFDVEEDRDGSDAQLLETCQAAKDAGIIVFTISDHVFDDRDDVLLEQCATSPAHHFHADEAKQDEALIEIGLNLAALMTSIKLQN